MVGVGNLEGADASPRLSRLASAPAATVGYAAGLLSLLSLCTPHNANTAGGGGRGRRQRTLFHLSRRRSESTARVPHSRTWGEANAISRRATSGRTPDVAAMS